MASIAPSPRRRSDLARPLVLGLLPVALALGVGCGKRIGEECEITGSGFHAKDPCRTQCLSRWNTICPDGRAAHLALCAGAASCTPGSCPAGQACYSFDDPFDERSYCVPANACGSELGDAERARWERTSAERAAATRARHTNEKRPTLPAPDAP